MENYHEVWKIQRNIVRIRLVLSRSLEFKWEEKMLTEMTLGLYIWLVPNRWSRAFQEGEITFTRVRDNKVKLHGGWSLSYGLQVEWN